MITIKNQTKLKYILVDNNNKEIIKCANHKTLKVLEDEYPKTKPMLLSTFQKIRRIQRHIRESDTDMELSHTL